MIQLVIDNIEQFKVYFDVVYDMTDVLELQFFEEKVVCSILDKSKTRFLNVEYLNEFFASYNVDEVASITIFVDDIFNLLKSTNKKDTLIIEINDEHMIGKIESPNGNTRVFEFVLPSDYIESPSLPSLETVVDFDITTDIIKQAVKDLGVIGSDLFRFVVTNNQLNIKAGSDTYSNYSSVYDVDCEGSADSMFTKEYIEQLTKFEKINKKVNIKLGDNYPVLYLFDDNIMGVKVMGMIAPRIESGDE